VLGLPAGAAANVTIGTTAVPAGASTSGCGGTVIGQSTNDPSTPYAVPPGGGEVTSWQINTTGATAGAPVTLVILRPSGVNFLVVGLDSETLPNPLPAGGIASFTVATPIPVQASDFLALYSPSGATCYFVGGSTLRLDHVFALNPTGAPTTGQTLTFSGESPEKYLLNAAVTITQFQDASVNSAPGPTGATAGSPEVLVSSVTNGGPEATPITFNDTIPAGVTVDTAAASSGACTVSGQHVGCAISGLPAGQSAIVTMTVTPGAPGTFTNTASVSTAAGVHDPNSANNSASTTWSVGPPPTAPSCVVPSLAGAPLALAEKVLGLLDCKVGKVTKTTSRKVAKGLVLGTTPTSGSYASGTVVKITESSGPPKHKRRKGHGKH
jgi:hypothetical protein